MRPLLTTESINLLREVYMWTLSDMHVHDLNVQKYMLCKKIAEVSMILIVPAPFLC